MNVCFRFNLDENSEQNEVKTPWFFIVFLPRIADSRRNRWSVWFSMQTEPDRKAFFRREYTYIYTWRYSNYRNYTINVCHRIDWTHRTASRNWLHRQNENTTFGAVLGTKSRSLSLLLMLLSVCGCRSIEYRGYIIDVRKVHSSTCLDDLEMDFQRILPSSSRFLFSFPGPVFRPQHSSPFVCAERKINTGLFDKDAHSIMNTLNSLQWGNVRGLCARVPLCWLLSMCRSVSCSIISNVFFALVEGHLELFVLLWGALCIVSNMADICASVWDRPRAVGRRIKKKNWFDFSFLFEWRFSRLLQPPDCSSAYASRRWAFRILCYSALAGLAKYSVRIYFKMFKSPID